MIEFPTAKGWDGYDADPPSPLAIQIAEELAKLYKFDRIAASAMGGVGMTVRDGADKAYVEIYNNGSSALMLTAGAAIDVESRVKSPEDIVSAIRDWRNILRKLIIQKIKDMPTKRFMFGGYCDQKDQEGLEELSSTDLLDRYEKVIKDVNADYWPGA